MERTAASWRMIVLSFALLAVMPMAAVSARQAGEEKSQVASGDTARVGVVELRVETSGSVTTTSLLDSYAGHIEQWQQDLEMIVGGTPDETLVIRFVVDPTSISPEATGTVTETFIASDDGLTAVVDMDRFLNLSETEAINVFRNVVARFWLVAASGGNMPEPMVDGFARYLEIPVLAQQARHASIGQQAYLDGSLPGWNDIIFADATEPDPDTAVVAASRTAVAAFLIERYGADVISQLAGTFAAAFAPAAPTIIEEVTGQPRERLDAAWDDFISAWFAGGWRTNLFAALDLAPAQDLFARGAYEAAVDRANVTLEVTTSLDDRAASADAELVIAQASVGIQAEALMVDAEEALVAHDYPRARTLIDRAEDQYALLPDDHHPVSLIDSWTSLAGQGLQATDDIEAAHDAYGNWFNMRTARRDAVAAGVAFAQLGDMDRHAAAQTLVDDLDARFTRLVLALGGAVLALVGWLAVWSWNRAPSRVRWPGVTDNTLPGGQR